MTNKEWEKQWMLEQRLKKEMLHHPPAYRKYGLTIRQQAQLLKKQNGYCAVCGCRFDWRGPHRRRSRAFDVDTKTKRVRGFVCRVCREKLKAFADHSFFLKVEEYLKNPPADEFYSDFSLYGE